MKTLKRLNLEIAPEVIQALTSGTASDELRAVVRLQLRVAAGESLGADPVTSQADLFGVTASERRADGSAQGLIF